MGIIDKKQASLIAGIGVGAALVLFTDAGRAARKRVARGPEKAPTTDEYLAARVCVELDHDVGHAKGIQVSADDHNITLRGVALRDELPDVLAAACNVKGVDIVTNLLDVHDSPGMVIALQE